MPVQYDIVSRNTKISSSMLLSYINAYLYNMILSAETLRYLVVCYCALLIHACTIWYCQRNTKISNILLLSAWCWISYCFFSQYHIGQVCIKGEEQYYTAGYLSVSSDNIILYRYALMEDNNMLLDILVFLLTISYCTGMY
jgi:hypothetical protein